MERDNRRVNRDYGRSEWEQGDRDERAYTRPLRGDAWSGVAVARGRNFDRDRDRDDDRDDWRDDRDRRWHGRGDEGSWERSADWSDRFDTGPGPHRERREWGFSERDDRATGGTFREGDRGRRANWQYGDAGGGAPERGGWSRGRDEWGRGPEARGYREVERDFGFRDGDAAGLSSGYGRREVFGGSGGYGYGQRPDSRGAHSGRGPRGYRRSDERIWEEACELLAHHGELDASGIDVRVENGEITLDGTVENRWSKRLAEDLLEDVRGVTDVHNRLRVQPAQSDAGWRASDRGWDYDARSNPGDFASRSIVSSRTPDATTGHGAPEQHARAGRWEITPDMLVVSADNDEIGSVKEVRTTDFLVDRMMQRDIYVPFSAVRTVEVGRVILDRTVGEVDGAGWESPSLVGADETGTGAWDTPAS